MFQLFVELEMVVVTQVFGGMDVVVVPQMFVK